MSLSLHFSPEASAQLMDAARSRGVDPVTVLETLVKEYLPPVVENTEREISTQNKVSAKNAAAITYLERKLQEDATDDPDEIRKSEQEIAELTHNLNEHRIEADA